jgi:hypothetical protein
MMPPAYYALVAALFVLDAALSRWTPASPYARRSALALAIAYPPIVLLPLLSPLAVTFIAAGAGMLGLVSFARMVGLADHARSFWLTVLCALSFFVAASVHWYGLFQAMPVFAMLFVAMAGSVRADPRAFLQRLCLSWLGLLVYGYLFAHATIFTDAAVTPLGLLPPAAHWLAVILLCAKLADVGWEAARRLGAKAEDLQIVVSAVAGALGGAAVHAAMPAALTAQRFAVLGLVVGLGIGAASRAYKLIVTDVLGEDPARPMKGTMLFAFAFALALGYHYIRYVA